MRLQGASVAGIPLDAIVCGVGFTLLSAAADSIDRAGRQTPCVCLCRGLLHRTEKAKNGGKQTSTDVG